MRGSVVGVLFCSVCLLAGAGVESQRTIKIGLPFANQVLSLEAAIEAALSGSGSLIAILQNLLLLNRPRGPVAMEPSGAARLAASLQGLLSAIINSAGQSVTSGFGLVLRLWRAVNQVIATVGRAMIRAFLRTLTGLRSARAVQRADDLRKKLLALIAGLRPSNLLNNLKKLPNPIAGVGKAFRGFFGVFRTINKLLGEYLRNAIYDTINHTIKSFVTGILSIPKNLIDTVKKLGKRLTTRPKPLRDLLNFLGGAVKKARETFAKGMRKIVGVVFNILGRLTGYLIDAVRRSADRFRNRLTQGLKAIPTAISKLASRLSLRGPLSRILGFIINRLARRIILIIDTITAIENGIFGIIRGIQAIIRSLILRAIGFVWNTLYTILIAHKVVGVNNLGKFLFNLIPRPGKFIGNVFKLIRDIRARRRARIQKIFDVLKNFLSNIFKNRPKLIPILFRSLQRIVQKQPLRQALNVVFSIGQDIAAIIRGAVRILIQLVLRFTVGGSLVATFVNNLFGGNSNNSKPSLLNRIAAIINAATSIITRLTGRGGLLKLISSLVSGLLYVFGPFFNSRS
ncbi:uncharacterized protein [Periplaneta americana]|uniref:uncharacterized protein n=1 Tax=Periplaneta americana TaxID=6978 RepID=UPI0037E97411